MIKLKVGERALQRDAIEGESTRRTLILSWLIFRKLEKSHDVIIKYAVIVMPTYSVNKSRAGGD